MQPRISIIIPVYNVEKYICQCLDSILAQTFQNYEVILVDDGSSDSSPAICDKYVQNDNRFRVIHQKNQGVSVARNNGIEICSGEFISFVDSDDWLEPLYISTLMEQSEDSDLVFFSHIVHSEDGLKAEYHLEDKTIYNEDDKEKYIIHMFDNLIGIDFYGFTWNKLFKREIILDHCIRFVSGLNLYEDEIFTHDYIQYAKKIRSISTSLYNYNWKVGGLSFSKKESWQYFKLAEKTDEFAHSLSNNIAISFFKKRAEDMLLIGLNASDMNLLQWYKAFRRLKKHNGQQNSNRHIAKELLKDILSNFKSYT